MDLAYSKAPKQIADGVISVKAMHEPSGTHEHGDQKSRQRGGGIDLIMRSPPYWHVLANRADQIDAL